MTKRLEGKVSIITGAASGIGRTTSLLFADYGSKVVVVDIDSEGGIETVNSIREKGGESIFINTDVSRENQVRRMVDETVSMFGGVDILFNNAGISTQPLRISILDLTERELDRVLSVNLKGTLFCARNVFPNMREKGGGSIINVSSVAARARGGALLTPYIISKAAVITLTSILANEWAPYDVRVNCILPGVTDTPMLREAWIQRYGVYKPLRTGPISSRVARPEEIANIVLFLASDESSYVSGAAIPVAGAGTGYSKREEK